MKWYKTLLINKYILTTVFILLFLNAIAGNEKENNKQQIQKVLNTFMNCLIEKDSTVFYSLFYTDPVVWLGVTHEKSYEDDVKKDSTSKAIFTANYKSFYRHFYNKNIVENFYNIQIIENGYIATVSFDYNFWENGVKSNWGMENWLLVKSEDSWKITSVIFSYEKESINPEPIQSKKSHTSK